MAFVTVSNGKGEGYNPNDKIMTPRPVAKRIIDNLPIKETDTLLDPFKGEGDERDKS